MKKILLLAMTVSSLLTFYSCKTTEANYKAAYDLATKNKQVNDFIDDTIADEAIPEQWAEYVAFTAECGGYKSDLKQYNVVVAQFRQIFNAKSMRGRLADMGYKSALVVQNGKQEYYVIAQSFNTKEDAVAAVKKIKNDKNLTIRTPYPRILLKR